MAREELWTRAAIVRTDGAGWLFLCWEQMCRNWDLDCDYDCGNTDRSVFGRRTEQS